MNITITIAYRNITKYRIKAPLIKVVDNNNTTSENTSGKKDINGGKDKFASTTKVYTTRDLLNDKIYPRSITTNREPTEAITSPEN